MSVDGVPAAVGPGEEGAERPVQLWGARWFRVLTFANVAVIVASAGAWSASLQGLLPASASWLVLLFPVVPATAAAPLVSAVIVGSAAALSSLSMFGEKQKGVRFIRAMTVWGTIALGAPVVLVAGWMLLAAVGGPWR